MYVSYRQIHHVYHPQCIHYNDPQLDQSCANVFDVGPALIQLWVKPALSAVVYRREAPDDPMVYHCPAVYALTGMRSALRYQKAALRGLR